jgi:hypothetical protein
MMRLFFLLWFAAIAGVAMPAYAQEPVLLQEKPAIKLEVAPSPEGQSDALVPEPAAGEEDAQEEPAGPLTPTDRIVKRFILLDTDESESVSFEEYMIMVQERAQSRFESMDIDKDGEVTAEEYREFWKTRQAQWYRLKR